MRRSLAWLINRFKRQFLIGLVVVVPVGVTLWVLAWIFNVVDSILQPIVLFFFDRTMPGVGFVITLFLIFFIGVISSNVVGRRLIQYGEAVLVRVPLVRPLYIFVKQIVRSFSAPSWDSFLKVVLVRFPREGILSIGFITAEISDQSGKKLFSVLIPTAPNPITGFLIVAPEGEVIRTNIRLDDAMKMVVSAGMQLPAAVVDELLLNTRPPTSGKA